MSTQKTDDLSSSFLLFNIILLLAFAPFLRVSQSPTADCDNFYEVPIFFGLAFVYLAVAGILGAMVRLRWIILIQVFLLVVLIAFLIGVTIFAYKIIHSRDHEYSIWMWNRVSNGKNWNEKKKYCLGDGLLCKQFSMSSNQTKFPDPFSYQKQYMRLKSGCCNPPESCKFKWSSSNSTSDNQSPNEPEDCKKWSHETLCLNCESCKVAVLENLKGHWTSFAIWNIVIVIFQIGNFFLGCFAFYRRWRRVSPVASTDV